MFVQLQESMEYRGKKYKKNDVIEVGGALGDSLVLNGHKRVEKKPEKKTTKKSK